MRAGRVGPGTADLPRPRTGLPNQRSQDFQSEGQPRSHSNASGTPQFGQRSTKAQTSPCPDQGRAKIEARLNELRHVFRTAEAFGIEGISDPRKTRWYVARVLEIAYKSLPAKLGFKSKWGVLPSDQGAA